MHVNLMPSNKIIVYDAKIYRVSRINLPDGVPCLPYLDANNVERLDCFAHAVEYDIETNQVRPLKINGGDPWCSSGGLSPDGTLVSTGGFADGARTIRYIGGGCTDCEWREYDQTLVEDRWYATQQILPNGEFILVGGRKSFSYEYIPQAEGQRSEKAYQFPFLYETSDIDENNLYPFVHLSTDGNLFIFSNNRSLLLDPTNHKVVRTFPVLPGGSRTSAWWDAEEPNFTPALYNPEKPKGMRFKEMKASQIARMYHSTSVLLPSGKVWIGGSNTQDTYRDNVKYPTETRIESFSPPYLDEAFNKYRPQINEDASQKELTYGNLFETEFSVEDSAGLTANDIKVTMYAPPFTTHGFSMGQRLVILKIDELTEQMQGNYRVRAAAPPSGNIAPPGYYLLHVVHRGIPSTAIWVWIH
ncbi:hypothetical protein TSUD_60170 [Trifolium subterraneum]|uniref:Galactose oxidase-like Early set domain-containing protein n=1 Tax=Trifolium subterraneum TaxID=3900 RepID=A0A2Z6P5E0_TRISU|nr:hypothetical protein TSUD_60170 [Trifolium subterraneum]